MFGHQSVVIIGAGASCHFGLPTGLGIYGQLLADCEQCLTLFNKNSDMGQGREYLRLQSHEDFVRHPAPWVLKQLANAAKGPDKSWGPENYSEITSQVRRTINLNDALNRSTAETIDEFLTLNPSHADICRHLIATRFFQALYSYDQGRFDLKPFWKRLAGKNRNWTHLFINAFKTNYLRGLRPIGKIDIISFNYDPILEIVLDEVFDASEQSIGGWRNFFSIHYPYGRFEAPKSPAGPMQLISQWSAEMRTVGPSVSANGVPQTDANLSALVRNCDIIYAAGFNFARDNCALIGLKPDRSKAIWYINWDNSPGLDDRVERYTAPSMIKKFADGNSEDRRMDVARATALGLFGELPA